MKRFFVTLAVLVMAFGNAGFAQRSTDLKSETTKKVLKHYGVRDETSVVPQTAEFLSYGMLGRVIYNYDEYDYYLTEEFTQLEFDGEWMDFGLTSYEYDFYGNVLEQLIQTAGETGWENLQLTTYTYDGILLSEAVVQEWDGNDWVNVTKEVYNYNDEVITVLYWEWNGSGWSSNELYTYTYGNDNIELVIQYMQGGAWQNLQRQTFTLDFDEHVTEIFVEDWDGTGWENSQNTLYDYNGGVYLSKKVVEWDEGSWHDSELYEFEYEDGNAVHGTCKVNDAGNWVPEDGYIEMAFGYSADNKTLFASEVTMTYVDLTSLNENAQAFNFVVYPVPAHDEIYIEAEGFQKAEIYNMMGQKLMESLSERMNVSNLSSGLYVMKVYDRGGGCATQRFVVR